MGNEKNAGNKTGNRLDYRQETMDGLLDRAKAECDFTDRLYEILLAYQKGLPLKGNPPNAPEGKIGELNHRMTWLYNLIWSAAIDLNGKGKSWKKKQQMEVKAA